MWSVNIETGPLLPYTVFREQETEPASIRKELVSMNSLNTSKVSPMGMATQRMLAIKRKDERVSVGVQRLSEAKGPLEKTTIRAMRFYG